MALLQNSPFGNRTGKKPLKNKDNFLKKSPNLPFRNSAIIGFIFFQEKKQEFIFMLNAKREKLNFG